MPNQDGVGIGSVQIAEQERGAVTTVLGDGVAEFVPGGGVHLGGDDVWRELMPAGQLVDSSVAFMGGREKKTLMPRQALA